MSHVDPRKVVMPDVNEPAGCHVPTHVDGGLQAGAAASLTADCNTGGSCGSVPFQLQQQKKDNGGAILHNAAAVNNAE